MSPRDCPDDELLRARRGELSAEEARALEAHLATCALCRMSTALGRGLDPLSAPDDEDESMARRLVARQLVPATDGAPLPFVRPGPRVVSLPVRRRPLGGRPLAFAAGFLLVTSLASAAYWTVHVRAVRRAAEHAASVAPRTRTTRAPGTTSAPPPARAVSPAPLLASPPERKPGASPPPAAPFHPPAEIRPTTPVTPETLLRDANEARRARHLDAAARLYRGLQVRFPSSREAILSRLSLGNVLLSQGAFAEALEQFRAYGRAPGDLAELGEEALLGQARALAALGRRDDERAVWHTLQSRFPTSEYAWRARQRLRELDGGAP